MGRSLRLSEGCMPTAVKDGYRFEGWYAWTDAGVVQEKELAELAKQEQYGTLEDELNEKYTEQTKLLENRESERYRHPVLHFTRSGTRSGSRSRYILRPYPVSAR